METEKASLYIKDAKGAIREWSIWSSDQTIYIEHGLYRGAMQLQTEEVDHGKAGRSLSEQIMSRIASRIHKQRDKGYSNNIEDADNKPVNLLGLAKPMLALPFGKAKSFNILDASIQPKLDGNRMLIANDNGNIIAYSRNGKIVNTVDHILDEVSIPPGTIIDGEIYCHGESLQTIVSWVKRKQENTNKLRFHAYDIVSDKTFVERNRMLEEFDLGSGVDLVETFRLNNVEQITDIFRFFRNQGYEGAIVRTNDSGYEDGKRSKSLLKVKEWFDDTFLVIDVLKSADGWGILKCQLANGKIFTVSAPGSIKEKTYVLNNKNSFIGSNIRVEYSQITKDGVPFHPVATNFIV